MSYGELKIDTITFTSAGVDASVSVSGLVQNPTFTGNLTTTGTISGDTIRGNTISGVTITGDTGNFTSGIFSTGTAAAPTIIFDGDPDTGFFSSVISGTTTQHVSYALSGVETLRLTNGAGDNRIQLNNFTSRVSEQVLIEDTGSTRVTIVGNNANGAAEGGAYLGLARAGAGSLNSFTSLASGNVMGKVEFRAANGVGNLFVGASIEGRADRNTGSTSTPGNLGFYTTASGSTTPTERMHINSEGNVGIGTADPAGFTPSLQIEGTDPGFFLNDSGTSEFFGMNVAAGEVTTWVEASADFAIGRAGGLTGAGYTESLRVTSSGQLLVGTNSATYTTTAVFEGNSASDTGQGQIYLNKGDTTVAADTTIGILRFGATGDRRGADIRGLGDGTWTAGTTHPTRLAFYTTASSSTTPTERLRIDSTGSIGIGTTGLTLQNNDGNYRGLQLGLGAFAFGRTDDSPLYLSSNLHRASSGWAYTANTTASLITMGTSIVFSNAPSGTAGSAVTPDERMRLDASGRLLLNVNSSEAFNGVAANLQIEGASNDRTRMSIYRNSDDTGSGAITFAKSRSTAHKVVANGDELANILVYGADGSDTNNLSSLLTWGVGGTPGTNSIPGDLRLSITPTSGTSPNLVTRIDKSGRLRVGQSLTTAPNYDQSAWRIHAQGYNNVIVSEGNSTGYTEGSFLSIAPNSGRGGGLYMLSDDATNSEWFIGRPYSSNDQIIFARATSVTTPAGSTAQTTNSKMTLTSAGNLSIVGSLSKGSGSFRIKHPLPEKAETHELVHSFIEGPQADLIYRGVATLVNGAAAINIDTEARMTEGTFEVLCRDVSCFTSNESDWTPVKGYVQGNILHIVAQDSNCTAEVSWLVIGERKDPHMYDTEWTDEEGRIIVEPEVSVTPNVEPWDLV